MKLNAAERSTLWAPDSPLPYYVSFRGGSSGFITKYFRSLNPAVAYARARYFRDLEGRCAPGHDSQILLYAHGRAFIPLAMGFRRWPTRDILAPPCRTPRKSHS